MNTWLLWPNGRAHYFSGNISLCGSVKLDEKPLYVIGLNPGGFYTCATCANRAPKMPIDESKKHRSPTRAERTEDLVTRSIPMALKAWGLQLGEGEHWEKALLDLALQIVRVEFRGRK